MRKKIVFLFFISNLCFLPFHSHAQNKWEDSELGMDTVRILCLYEQKVVLDTLNPQRKANNPMLLQIGKHCSKYFSFYQYLFDSVSYVMGMKAYEMAQIGQELSGQEAFDEIKKISIKSMPRELNYMIFKNYPHKGQLTLLDRFGMDRFKYEEPLPEMQWQLSNDTLTVCGYVCKRATCAFRGRNYTVWYTQEIPVSDGPWKFNGLPGLILRATDDQKHYSFECTAIETPKEIKQIYYLDGNGSRKIGRPEYNKAKQRFMDNPGAYMSGNPILAVEGTTPLPASSYKKVPYNPIERTDE
jgi:GLPGLI family protein